MTYSFLQVTVPQKKSNKKNDKIKTYGPKKGAFQVRTWCIKFTWQQYVYFYYGEHDSKHETERTKMEKKGGKKTVWKAKLVAFSCHFYSCQLSIIFVCFIVKRLICEWVPHHSIWQKKNGTLLKMSSFVLKTKFLNSSYLCHVKRRYYEKYVNLCCLGRVFATISYNTPHHRRIHKLHGRKAEIKREIMLKHNVSN